MATTQIQKRTPPERTRSESGFALLGLTLLSFIFFSSVFFFSFFAAIVQADQRIKHQCLALSWQHQEKQKNNIEKLLQLNPQALALRQRWQLAQKRLLKAIASGNPTLVAAAKAHLLVIQLKKTKLAAQQNSILFRARFDAENFQTSLRTKIQTRRILTSPTGLAVEPELSTELASPYKPQESFSKNQKSGAQWENQVHQLIPAFLQKTVRRIEPLPTLLNQKIPGQCWVTLEKRSLKWFVTLTAAKS